MRRLWHKIVRQGPALTYFCSPADGSSCAGCLSLCSCSESLSRLVQTLSIFPPSHYIHHCLVFLSLQIWNCVLDTSDSNCFVILLFNGACTKRDYYGELSCVFNKTKAINCAPSLFPLPLIHLTPLTPLTPTPTLTLTPTPPSPSTPTPPSPSTLHPHPTLTLHPSPLTPNPPPPPLTPPSPPPPPSTPNP